MLSESFTHIPAFFALALQTSDSSGQWVADLSQWQLPQLILRWLHFVAGITWIGLLYFFNLVNVPLMKKLDAPTKGKVIPELMPRALWFFRWGAVVTVLAGLTYYAMYILAAEAPPAGATSWGWLGLWFLIVLVAYAIIYALINSVTKDGRVLAVLIAVIVIAMSVAMLYLFSGNKTISIGIGGGLGMIMLLNVWGIIWRAQKKIIAWTKENAENGTPIPAESAQLARKAFLASRANAWLSLPMLFFMATSSHHIIFIK
jgi:uncharacterized membrane protein